MPDPIRTDAEGAARYADWHKKPLTQDQEQDLDKEVGVYMSWEEMDGGFEEFHIHLTRQQGEGDRFLLILSDDLAKQAYAALKSAFDERA